MNLLDLMSSFPQNSRWRRIYRQTATLTHKNLLVFYKSWLSTIIRAFIFPLLVAIIFAELKHLNSTNYATKTHDNYGISSVGYPVRGLAEAMEAVSSRKVVFVRNGLPIEILGPIIDKVLGQPGMEKMETHSVDDPNDLFDLCKQSTTGHSDCFASVIFQAFNDTNVEYAIALDEYLSTGYYNGDYRADTSLFSERIFPLQWAIGAQIGNFSASEKPSTVPFSGYFGPNVYHSPDTTTIPLASSSFWMSMVSVFVAPIFILILIGAVYHVATFVATERESGISDLMGAQTVTTSPRIMSTLLAFFILYFPGLLASSIILTQVLFIKTSDILLLFLTLLTGASTITSAHFIASLFGKAQLAGLTASTLAFALALITLVPRLTLYHTTADAYALGLLFPPCTWAYLIGDIASREFGGTGFSVVPEVPLPGNDKIQRLDGYLYIIYLIVQILVYTAATYGLEKKLWGVNRDFQKIEASSDVAFRCSHLTKTYYGKRPWYWPFVRRGKTVGAVNNLNLEVKKGSVTFLLGPNGGGKTTILKCIAGMTKVDPGTVLQLNEDGLVFGICPQMNAHWDNLTVEEHIKIWRKLKTAAFDNHDTDNDDVMTECDLLEKMHAPAKTLSGGQARKLQLAIAFVGGSKVCCIDEASSGLDPLSRRNIWNIIQRGHERRTILITTHFLDEADVLSDHIAIVYNGKLVCEGPGTSLKACFGDDYLIESDSSTEDDTMVWKTSNSTEATKKMLELEASGDDRSYTAVFPTLEQVFLKVTSDTVVHRSGGDGIIDVDDNLPATEGKTFGLEEENQLDLDLEVGKSISLIRQIMALSMKRYSLLLQMSGWLSYAINLLIPILVAVVIMKYVRKMKPLQTCAVNVQILRTPLEDSSGLPSLVPLYGSSPPKSLYDQYSNDPTAYIGPASAFEGATQDEIYIATLSKYFQPSYYTLEVANSSWQAATALDTRAIVNTTDSMTFGIANSSAYGYYGFGLFAPTLEETRFYYNTYESFYIMMDGIAGFDLLINRISNQTSTTGSSRLISTDLRTFKHAENRVPQGQLPYSVLITLSFVAAASIAVIYPAFEKTNHVRALHYSNGVEPIALWLGYLLFDFQIILIQSIVVWALLFAGSMAKIWYEPNYVLGALLLFGIATYLGTYALSLFVKKASFAIAAGTHVLFVIIYLVGYLLVNFIGNGETKQASYALIQYGLGLIAPGANLLRALWVSGNSWEVLCGKYGDADTSNPFAYVRYGSIYTNLVIQIVFCAIFLVVYEYGSLEWVRRHTTQRRLPARLHYIVEAGASGAPPTLPTEAEKQVKASSSATQELLEVKSISKIFAGEFAVQNVSFAVRPGCTLALLGGNGAGKTTIINMIRGELKPSFGDIFVDGINVQQNTRKSRLSMGVCPQDDAVDNLTVGQTLRFYATVKGLKNTKGNVIKVMEALNISEYESVRVMSLSGGTKRKLSVAIALLGNPKILLLDEPSTGQDAGAKRILWHALKGLGKDRAMLLTTHSMEEAEALASDVVIVGGRVLAEGSLGSLQKSYGGGFTVKAVRAEGVSEEEMRSKVEGAFEEVKGYVDRVGVVQWEVAMGKSKLGGYMKICEELMGTVVDGATSVTAGGGGGSGTQVVSQKVISDYTITGPSLEEVFMNVAKKGAVMGGV